MMNQPAARWRRVLDKPLLALHVPGRGALRWFWLDGLAASIHESMLLTFIPLFALALGATALEIGWLSALGSLLGTIMLLPGARLAERSGNPHRMVVLAGYLARFMVLALFLWPFTGRAGVWGVIAFATLRSMMIQLSMPGWTSIAADIVPTAVRGRYFASRNLIMALGSVLAVPLAGQLIKGIGGLVGYRLNFLLAFVVGVLATYFYSRIENPTVERPIVAGKRLPVLARLRQHPIFLLFCVHAALWNFSLQVAAPFFNVYLVKVVGASTVVVGLVGTVVTLSSLPGQQFWGHLADRIGVRRALLWSGAFIPLAPIAWMWVSSPWHVAWINLFSGFLWAGYNLITFNFLLAATPDERRPSYVALYSTIVGLANAGGAALGGWVAEAVSFQMVFLLSGIGRALAMLIFFLFVAQPTAVTDVAETAPDHSETPSSG